MNDLRVALRRLARRPGLAAVVVLTLSVGIGATTAIFSAVESALLRPPPYPASDELRIVHKVLRTPESADTSAWWSFPMFEAFRAAEPELGQIAAYTQRAGTYNLATSGAPQRARVEFVSASYFDVLGALPARGRFFLADEDRIPEQSPVVVLSHGVWASWFGRDSAIVGATIRLNTIPFTVVGVAPPGFTGLAGEADLWAPMMMAPTLTFPRRLAGPLSFWHGVVLRVAPGTPDDALAARLAARARVVAPQLPLKDGFGDVTLGFAAQPLANARIHPGVRATLRVLMGAAAFVLLIVCVNVVNMLLTQAARRQREFGVRIALGASATAIARLILAESLVLGVWGGVGGLVVAIWVLDLVRTLAPPIAAGMATPADAGIGMGVLVFNFAVATVAGLVVGLLPARRVAHLGVRTALKASDRVVTERRRLRGALVAAQVALAVVLLTGAGLMVRSLQHLRNVDPGFNTEHLLTARVTLPRQAYDDSSAVRFLDRARARLASLPGVESATIANCLPIAGGCDRVRMEIRGRDVGEAAPPTVQTNFVESGYFRSIGIPLLEGRTFDASDRIGAPGVAMLNRTAARRYWPDGGALGAAIGLSVGWDGDVVGIVDDTRGTNLDAPAPPRVYVPYAQFIYNTNFLVVRAAADPLSLAAPVRAAIRDLDPTLPVWDIQTMDERLSGRLAATRFASTLLGLAALLATVLAAVGVFSVMAFLVASRVREFGIRMALGARGEDVRSLVMRQGLLPTGIGLAVGLTAAVVLTRTLSSLVRGVRHTDPVTLAVVVGLMALVAAAASWIPARRATRVNPMEALRHE